MTVEVIFTGPNTKTSGLRVDPLSNIFSIQMKHISPQNNKIRVDKSKLETAKVVCKSALIEFFKSSTLWLHPFGIARLKILVL